MCSPSAGVPLEVGDVHLRGLVEVGAREVEVPDLGGDDRLRAGRQRRVAHAQLLVVVEVASLLLVGEGVAAPVHREHEVGLLDDLLAVEAQVGVVQQQRVVLGRRVLEVPALVLEEVRVLGVDAALLVVGHVHQLGRALPGGDARPRRRRAARRSPGSGAAASAAALQVQLRHQVRVDVVVDQRRVLVRAGDAVDAEVAVLAVVAEAGPQPRALDQQLAARSAPRTRDRR